MLKNLLIVFLFLVITSCSSKQNKLKGTWKFTELMNDNSSLNIAQTSFESLFILSDDGQFLMIDSGILVEDNLDNSLFSTENKDGSAYYGNWIYNANDSIIELTPKNYSLKQPIRFKVAYNDDKNMILNDVLTTKQDLKYTHIDYNDVSQSKYNFLAEDLNFWRIKSSHKETDAEIKNRLISSIKFSIAFLNYYKENDSSAMTYFLKPLPFKFAGNGIGFMRNHENWDELFFDQEDADKANLALKNSFNSVAKIPEKYKNKPIDINLFILEEVLKNIEN